MIELITFILTFIFIAFCLIISFVSYKKNNSLNILIVFVFSLILFNGILPFFLINESLDYNLNKSFSLIENYTIEDIFLYYSQNIILLFSTFLGWRIIKRKYKTVNQNITIENKYLYNKTIGKIAKLLLSLSIIAYYVYSIAYGGFISLISYTSDIRSGITEVKNPISFLQKFGGFSVFATLLFAGLLVDKTYNKRMKPWFLFSFVFSVYYLYSLGGRVTFISFFVILILGYGIYKSNYKIKIDVVIKGIIVSLISISGIYYITRIFTRKSAAYSLIDFLLYELSFPFASFNGVIPYAGIYKFKHIVLTPLYFLPTSIWEVKMELKTASSFNTFLFMGAEKGVNGVTGSVPLDIVSFSWLEGGAVGALIIGILFGIFIGFLQKFINSILSNGVKAFIFSYAVLNLAVKIVNYGDPVHVIQGCFSFFIGSIFLIFSLKRLTNKKLKYRRIFK